MSDRQGRAIVILLAICVVSVAVSMATLVFRRPASAHQGAAQAQNGQADAAALAEQRTVTGEARGQKCKANLDAIAASLSAYALRNGQYIPGPDLTVLTTTPEALSEIPQCPLGGAYEYTHTSAGGVVLRCPNAADHAQAGGTASDWEKTLAPVGTPQTIPQ